MTTSPEQTGRSRSIKGGQRPRPEWPYREIKEADFRAIHQLGMVAAVTAKWEMTGADTIREWLVATNRDGKTLTLPKGWKDVLKFLGYAANPGLFGLTYLGEQCLATIRDIDAWEAENAADRAEFERLRAKFGGSKGAIT